MTATEPVESGEVVRIRPGVAVGPAATSLPEAADEALVHVVVDTSLHLPDMFEILFDDPYSDVLEQAGISIGTTVEISSIAVGTAHVGQLVTGEVTAIEGLFADVRQTLVRGYTADHRLQRRRTTRTFVNMTDADIARKVASDAGLTVGKVTATRTTHDHVGQANQTDWEFLRARASRIGYEFGVSAGTFYFRPSSKAERSGAVPIVYPDGLTSFRPRVSAGNLAGSAEVRSWDTAAGKSAASVVAASATSVALEEDTPASVAAAFVVRGGGLGAAPPSVPHGKPGAGDLGPEPSKDALVVGGWPVGTSTKRAPADEAAKGLAEELGSTFAEAEGEASGDPRLLSGTTLDIGGVGATFGGLWTITRAVHVFDLQSYRTQLEVSGRQDRSLLGLTTGGAEAAARIPGLAGGIVTNVADPEKLGRVKVSLPWLAPSYETDWAPVAQAGAGATTAALFLPDVGDEVLVGFELGDMHRPVVLGGLVNSASTHTLGGDQLKRTGNAASVVRRGVVTPTGNRLAFHDEPAPGGRGSPLASSMVLGTASANMALAIDQSAGTVSLTCKPAPPGSKSTKGSLTIECGPTGTIDIKTGPGGTVNIDGGAKIDLKASAMVNIESQGAVVIKGNPIKLN